MAKTARQLRIEREEAKERLAQAKEQQRWKQEAEKALKSIDHALVCDFQAEGLDIQVHTAREVRVVHRTSFRSTYVLISKLRDWYFAYCVGKEQGKIDERERICQRLSGLLEPEA